VGGLLFMCGHSELRFWPEEHEPQLLALQHPTDEEQAEHQHQSTECVPPVNLLFVCIGIICSVKYASAPAMPIVLVEDITLVAVTQSNCRP
jgi:hypothetical protein